MVPHLLGFHPAESLVVLVLDGPRVALTARCDLDQLRDHGASAAFAQQLMGAVPDPAVWLIAYSSDAELAWQVLDQTSDAFVGQVLGRLYVDGQAWWQDPDDCGGDYRPASSAAAAEATLAGLPARASRRELEAALDPTPIEASRFAELQRAARGVLSQLTRRGRAARLSELLLSDPDRVRTEDECVQLSQLIADPDCRLQAMVLTTADRSEDLERVWTRVVRLMPADARVDALALLGLAAWASGSGALSNICLERAQAIDDLHPLACLLDRANREMWPPSIWEELRHQLEWEGVELRRVRRPRSRRRR